MLAYTDRVGDLDEVVISDEDVDSDFHRLSRRLFAGEFVNGDENVIRQGKRTPKMRVPERGSL